MASSSPSNALIKRSSDVDLMPPPPPPKRIKRPPKVLDEDDYTDALSHIIARDFFPGLLETQVQQDYLDAVESKDKEWIAAAGRNLSAVMTPGRQQPRGRRGVSIPLSSASGTPRLTPRPGPGDTPRQWAGDTPMSVASTTVSTTETTVSESATMKADAEKMSLGAFQSKYTSEDNESFNALLDRQNTKRREKYAWMWGGNKIPSARQIAHRQREAKRLEGQKSSENGSKELIKTDMDARPARPDTWKSIPENSLMFTPSSVEDTHETVQQKAEATSRIGPKRVLYHNTRIQHTPSGGDSHNEPPPSPSISAIRDAIAGRPRFADSESGFTGGETPRVNGYAFVDEDEPEPEPTAGTAEEEAEYHLKLLTSTASSTPNPFKLQETRRREALHHRMVERVAKTKRTEKIASTMKTPVPRFPSSPMVGLGGQTPGGAGLGKAGLTPAGQRLWASVGNSTPRRVELSGGGKSGLKNMWTPTPKRGR